MTSLSRAFFSPRVRLSRVAGRSKEQFAEQAFADAHPLGAASQSWTGIFRVVYSVRRGHLAICRDL